MSRLKVTTATARTPELLPINSYAIIKRLGTDPNVTKSARNHCPAYDNGEIPPDHSLIYRRGTRSRRGTPAKTR